MKLCFFLFLFLLTDGFDAVLDSVDMNPTVRELAILISDFPKWKQ